jgi:hypothetical protein
LVYSIFLIHFEEALSARGRWGHFDGSIKKPILSPTPSKDEQEKLDEWEKEERTARYMLSQKLPDSAVVRICKLDTVAKKWELVSNEFTRKGLFARSWS